MGVMKITTDGMAHVEVNGKTVVATPFTGMNWKNFEATCVKVQKKSYVVEVMLPDKPTKVKNFLEGAEYLAQPSEGAVITKGTVGEMWVAKMEKVCKTYKKLDGTALTPNDLTPGRFIRVKTVQADVFNYAMFVPSPKMFAVQTGWGDVLVTNLPDVPHGKGDFIVCGEKDGKPDLSDMWVVNGSVFDSTYQRVSGTDPEQVLRLLAEKAKNPDLSVPSRITDLYENKKTLSSFDNAYQQGKVKIAFIGSDSARRDVTLEISERKNGDGKTITYYVNNLPMITKNVDEAYKTVKGLANGICSAYVKTNPIHKINALPHTICVVKQGKVVHTARIAPFSS